MTTVQEQLWAGRFGEEYTARQNVVFADNREFFSRALGLANLDTIDSVIEFGANIGGNLVALRSLLGMWRCPDLPVLRLDGVEINAKAYEALRSVTDRAWLASVCDFEPVGKWDLALSKGLLIHIHPSNLPKAYQTLYNTSKRYILICEYFNPTPVTVEYRKETEALWKRDFGGDMLDHFPALKCLDYGFVWRRDRHPQDDLTWWLFEKEGAVEGEVGVLDVLDSAQPTSSVPGVQGADRDLRR